MLANNFHKLSKLNVARGGSIWNIYDGNFVNSHSRILPSNKFLNFKFATFTRKQNNPLTKINNNNKISKGKDVKFHTSPKNFKSSRLNNQKTPSIIDKDLVCKPIFNFF